MVEGDRKPIEQHVACIATLDEDGKLAYLQRLVGSETSNAYELDWRAKLFTALNDAGTWPHRGDDDAYDCWEKDDGA